MIFANLNSLSLLYAAAGAILLAASPWLLRGKRFSRRRLLGLVACISALFTVAVSSGYINAGSMDRSLAVNQPVFQRTADTLASLESWIDLPALIHQQGVLYVVSSQHCAGCRIVWAIVPALRSAGWDVRYGFYGNSSGDMQDFVSAFCSRDPAASLGGLFNGVSPQPAECHNDVREHSHVIDAAVYPPDPFFVLDNGVILRNYTADAGDMLNALLAAHRAFPTDPRLVVPAGTPRKVAPDVIVLAK